MRVLKLNRRTCGSKQNRHPSIHLNFVPIYLAHTIVMDFIIGGLAGAGATVITNPMDVVKTRLQLQGELTAKGDHVKSYRGIFHAMYVIGKTDGALALQKGLAPAMLFGFAMNSVRLGLYHAAETQGWTKSKNGDIVVQKAVFWSSASGMLSGILSNPASVLKTRIQAAAHPSIAVGRQHRYNGPGLGCRVLNSGPVVHSAPPLISQKRDVAKPYCKRETICLLLPPALPSRRDGALPPVTVAQCMVLSLEPKKSMFHGFTTIYKTEGLRGYFAGVTATCTRLAIGSAAQLTTFSTVKEWLRSHGVCAHSPFGLAFVSSAVSGVAVAVVICPLDVITVRLYNQGSSRHGGLLYTGVLDCLTKIFRTEGIHGLYKGIGPLYLRIAPHTTLSLVIWDMLNNLLLH